MGGWEFGVQQIYTIELRNEKITNEPPPPPTAVCIVHYGHFGHLSEGSRRNFPVFEN
jgi:hypothetical protein